MVDSSGSPAVSVSCRAPPYEYNKFCGRASFCASVKSDANVTVSQVVDNSIELHWNFGKCILDINCRFLNCKIRLKHCIVVGSSYCKVYYYYKRSLEMNDNYTHHVDSNVFYITENIMGPCDQSAEYERLLNDFNSTYDENCSCKDICSQATCKCLQKSCGDNYLAYQKDGQLKYKLKPKSKSYPILECNDSCPCSIECGNRVVQKGPLEGLEIRRCDKGFGLFAACSIPSGAFLCEYAGEIITPNQASVRHHNNKMLGKNNYIFYLRELSDSHPTITIIDPSVFGNIGRYINHSCEPNCQILPVRCGSPIPKLAIFAYGDILPNEEVTFHYGTSDNSNPVTETDLTRCLCKAGSCSGFMPFQKY